MSEGKGDGQEDHERGDQWKRHLDLKINLVFCGIDSFSFKICNLFLEFEEAELVGFSSEKPEILRGLQEG